MNKLKMSFACAIRKIGMPLLLSCTAAYPGPADPAVQTPRPASLIVNEIYGEGAGKNKTSDLFFTQKNATLEVIDDALVVSSANGTEASGILGFGMRLSYPLTIDIKMQVEFGKSGSVELQAFQPGKMAVVTFDRTRAWSRTSQGDQQSVPVSVGSDDVTFRLLFDAEGHASFTLLDGGSAGFEIPLSDVPSVTNHQMRINFQDAKIFIREIQIYEEIPGQTQ